MAKVAASRGVRTFAFVAAGQMVSHLGSGLTSFAVFVWMFEKTGQVTSLSLIILCASLPGILMGPTAGALVDRWDRRWAMILSDSCAALATLLMAALYLTDLLSL